MFAERMVVGDDQFEPNLGCPCNLGRCNHSTVNGDHEANAAGMKRLQGFDIEAVALLKAVWNI